MAAPRLRAGAKRTCYLAPVSRGDSSAVQKKGGAYYCVKAHFPVVQLLCAARRLPPCAAKFGWQVARLPQHNRGVRYIPPVACPH